MQPCPTTMSKYLSAYNTCPIKNSFQLPKIISQTKGEEKHSKKRIPETINGSSPPENLEAGREKAIDIFRLERSSRWYQR